MFRVKPTVIYISGFGSRTDRNSPKVRMFEDMGFRVRIVSAIPPSPQEYTRRFFEVYDATVHTVIVGTSLGGYWARRFGMMTGEPWIALNPIVSPYMELSGYKGNHTVYQTDESFTFNDYDLLSYSKLEPIHNYPPGMVIAALDDPIIDHGAIAYMENCAVHAIDKGGHRLENVEDYKYLIEYFIKGPADHGLI